VDPSSSDAGLVVVGSGIAGRMAALHAAAFGQVVLVTDGALDHCNSLMAQGGVHAPVDGDVTSMARDVIDSARVPLDCDRVRRFSAEAVDAATRLEQWGLEFDRAPDGAPRRRMAGGMSQARVLTAGDDIGRPLLKVLREQLEGADIEVRTKTRVTDLRPGDGGVDVVVDGSVIHAKAVVVATGGTSYTHGESIGVRTTNPRNANNVLYDALVRRGAETVHAEFWQYQPFGLVDGPAGPPGRCVPETVDALGQRLLDRHGRQLCELPVDRLTLTEAMFASVDRALAGERGPGFQLTLSDLDDEVLLGSYPKLARTLRQMGDQRDVLVWPFLHYQLGGLAYDLDGRTSLPGVFAAGEVTGGLHGRNRLMGAGITDALVHGWRAGGAAARDVHGRSS
jgi:L-aspartate oxidase